MMNEELNQYLVEWAQAGGQNPYEDFARYVRVMRRRYNYAREEFAQLLEISLARLIVIENGLILPTEYEQRSIENYLKLSYSEFYERVTPVHSPHITKADNP